MERLSQLYMELKLLPGRSLELELPIEGAPELKLPPS
jgi:hypothetical protein